MLSENLGAKQPEKHSLINKAVPQEEFASAVDVWANKIAANAPLAIQEMRSLFRHGLTQDFESHSHHVLMSVLNLFQSDDFKEGVQSFVTRKAPEFKGK